MACEQGRRIWLALSPDGSFFTIEYKDPAFLQNQGKQLTIRVTKTIVGSLYLAEADFDCASGKLTAHAGHTRVVSDNIRKPGLIEYRIGGLRDWSPDSVFIVSTHQWQGTTFTLEIRQDNQVLTKTIATRCTNRPSELPLTLASPNYNCATGELILHTAGGNGSLIEYQIPGIFTWNINPGLILDYALRQDSNRSSRLTLMARQSGEVVSRLFNFRVFCQTAARVGPYSAEEWQVRILGNPLPGNELEVEVQGAEGKPLQLRVTDLQGREVASQHVERSNAIEHQRLTIRPGTARISLLQVSTPTRRQTITLMKISQQLN